MVITVIWIDRDDDDDGEDEDEDEEDATDPTFRSCP